MSLAWFEHQTQFNTLIHAKDFDLEQAVACRFDIGNQVSLRDIFKNAIHEALINKPNAQPSNIAVNRCIEVLAECGAKDLFRANFLITHGGLAAPEVIRRHFVEGSLAVDVQVLNDLPERDLKLNLDWCGDLLNPASSRLVAEHLWDWVDYQYSLRNAMARSTNAPVVGELLNSKPISDFCSKSTFSTEAFQHPNVLRMILRSGQFENGQQGQAMRASILSGDRSLVEGMGELVARHVRGLQDPFKIRSEVSVYKALLSKYFPEGQGADPALLKLARRSFESILDDQTLEIR